MRWHMIKAVIRIDLYRLFRTKDYWIPLLILGGLFFVVMPVMLLGSLGLVQRSPAVAQIGQIIGTLPDAVQQNIQGDNPATRASYAFAVYLLAPIAIIVPLTNHRLEVTLLGGSGRLYKYNDGAFAPSTGPGPDAGIVEDAFRPATGRVRTAGVTAGVVRRPAVRLDHLLAHRRSGVIIHVHFRCGVHLTFRGSNDGSGHRRSADL